MMVVPSEYHLCTNEEQVGHVRKYVLLKRGITKPFLSPSTWKRLFLTVLPSTLVVFASTLIITPVDLRLELSTDHIAPLSYGALEARQEGTPSMSESLPHHNLASFSSLALGQYN
ncbi:hypothetical protein YC2023_065250 [Brassica napus]